MNTPLRIALIRQTYRPDGGAERFVSRALDALVTPGVEVSLFARRYREGLEKLKDIGTALKDAWPPLRKTLMGFGIK